VVSWISFVELVAIQRKKQAGAILALPTPKASIAGQLFEKRYLKWEGEIRKGEKALKKRYAGEDNEVNVRQNQSSERLEQRGSLL
jgi:hypothetical protein